MLAASSDFFAQPTEVKLRCTPADPSINRGYAARGTEALSYSIGRDAADPICSKPSTSARTMSTTTIPSMPLSGVVRSLRTSGLSILADLRPALVGYFAEARRLALMLTEVFAVALGLPDGWFAPYVDRSTTTMRTIRYERRGGEADPLPGQQRMGVDTDYGIVTVLYAEPVAGLQIVAPDGEWIDVIPADDALVINLGDLTAQVDQRPVAIDSASSRAPASGDRQPGGATQRGVFLDGNWDARDRVPADVHHRR